MLTASSIAQILVNGLTAGAFYVLMALGFTLIFGILRLVNFAHGEFYMLGAFVVYHLYAQMGLNFFAALAASAVGDRHVSRRSRPALAELSMLMSASLAIAIQGDMA